MNLLLAAGANVNAVEDRGHSGAALVALAGGWPLVRGAAGCPPSSLAQLLACRPPACLSASVQRSCLTLLALLAQLMAFIS